MFNSIKLKNQHGIDKNGYIEGARSLIGFIFKKGTPLNSQATLKYQDQQIKYKPKVVAIDSLTMLPTRLQLIEDIKNSLQEKKPKYASTLFYFQIDGYEEVNEFFGIDIGYKLLQEITKWFMKNLPSKDATLYKFEHDTFAIFDSSRLRLNDLERYLKKVYANINKTTFIIDGTTHDISFTIGVSRGKGEELLKFSYLALKEAKKQNKPFNIFNKKSQTEERFLYNIQINKEIRSALNEDRIVPFFQPILNIKTNKIEKYESLMRIQNRDNSHQVPSEFLEIAKQSKLYPEMTKAMLKASLKRIEMLDQATTINLSIEDIMNPSVSSFIMRRLDKFSHPYLLTFEIVESEEIINYKKISNFIKKIKSYGCTIAIDDFGSGYSNFEHVLKLDIDYIKIDGSLIKNILKSPKHEIVAKTIINFSKELGVKTVAEYVSSEAIFDKVKELGIDYAQGYYIGKPSPIKMNYS